MTTRKLGHTAVRSPAVGVVGERETTPQSYADALAIGREVGTMGALLVCGGMGGIMEAACRGCTEAGGIAVGILPGDDVAQANPYVSVPIVTGMGEGRNIIVVRSSAVIVAVGGSYGTLSEIALALRLGIPVIGLRTWSFQPGRTEQPTQDFLRVDEVPGVVEALRRRIPPGERTRRLP